MLDRVRIRALRDAGHTLEEIAATVGTGKRSVQRIVKEPAIQDPESAPTPVSRGVGRPSTVEAYQDHVERILKGEPALPTVEILSRVRGLGYTGGKSAIYGLVKVIRPPKTESPEVRFEGVPGEFGQHDFGSVKVTYADGSSEKVHFFASRLKYSRWTHVVTVPNEKVKPLIRALLGAVESFGGVPLSVCKRTISRWRHLGLVGRKVRFPDGRVRVAFTEQSFQQFARQNSAVVRRGRELTRLTTADKRAIVQRAKDLVPCFISPATI